MPEANLVLPISNILLASFDIIVAANKAHINATEVSDATMCTVIEPSLVAELLSIPLMFVTDNNRPKLSMSAALIHSMTILSDATTLTSSRIRIGRAPSKTV